MKVPVRKALFLWVAVLSAPLAGCASASLLGQRAVGFGVDRDVIAVGAVAGRFRAVRIHVSDSPLEMFDVRFTFGDGSRWSPDTRYRFEQGSWSRRIDLPGRARVIRRIEFRYRSIGVASGRARVQAFGIR